MELWDKAERLWTRVKNWKTVRGWHIWKLKLVDARLYFVSMFVGLLTGLVAVPYHYLLYYLFPPQMVLVYPPFSIDVGHSGICFLAGQENAFDNRGRYSADTRRD